MWVEIKNMGKIEWIAIAFPHVLRHISLYSGSANIYGPRKIMFVSS